MTTRTKFFITTGIACTVILFITLLGFAIHHEMNQPSYSCLASHTVEVHEPAHWELRLRMGAPKGMSWSGNPAIPMGDQLHNEWIPEKNYTKTVCDEWSPATPAR